MIYFDNAATTGKKPAEVINAMNYALKNYSANPGRSGHKPSVETAEAVYKVREKVSDFFGCSGPQNVCFTLNCTHSLNCVIKGVLQKGDHVVVSSLEHNAVMRPLKKIGISYDVAQVSLQDDSVTVNNISKKIKPNTKLVLCTGASNVLGKILPIKEIGTLCRKKGVLFAVDGAQTAGVLPINMKEMNIDFLCIAPHKGLYAPMGIGLLICEKWIPATLIEGGTGTNSIEMHQPAELPERLESGTLNVPAILGVGAGIEHIKKKGLSRIYNGELSLISRLYNGLRNINGVKLYTPDPTKYGYVPVLSFNVGDFSSADVADMLSENGFAVRGGLHCAPSAHSQIGTISKGTVRVSVAEFNTAEEISRLLNVIDKKIGKKT